MNTLIQNANDLKLEIARLKNLEVEQSVALKSRFASPAAIFSTAMTLFPKSPTVDGVKNESFFSQDFLGLLSRILLPLTLNKTLFKHSNFLVKTLVGILSQKASHYISEDAVQGIWGKAKALFAKFTQKKAETKVPVPAYVNS
ncbi:hypothetical protein [Mucilaginibacter psychrotolerans]|uniref:Uncharacterized protein n=1 Tax=Mucilaginibacter psychrotolerans TaxID=1524096 RepID=A0A4Y8S8E4_9SPHI|nr:hypothetical protein [Mucilaginibacter psychrotolerans]TFF35172.1 hypothetical protein E2R66_19605 [Mucilaginibacter psychrotolerans]